jgi:molybdopterin synthase catalytic subunit
MRITLHLGPEPIPAALPPPDAGPGIGAVAEFRGLVRGEENGEPIRGLLYEAYQPMAGREITRILDELAVTHPVHAVRVIHRLGPVPVGEAAIYVGVAARHRAEAFALLSGFMDRLKQNVPIWKTDVLPA